MPCINLNPKTIGGEADDGVSLDMLVIFNEEQPVTPGHSRGSTEAGNTRRFNGTIQDKTIFTLPPLAFKISSLIATKQAGKQ
jgi:hypothetical protein